MGWYNGLMPLPLAELIWNPDVTLVRVDFSDDVRDVKQHLPIILESARAHNANPERAVEGFALVFAFKDPKDAMLFKLSLP